MCYVATDFLSSDHISSDIFKFYISKTKQNKTFAQRCLADLGWTIGLSRWWTSLRFVWKSKHCVTLSLSWLFSPHFPQKEQFRVKAFIDFLSLILVYDSVHYRISWSGRQSEHWAGGQGWRLASRSLLSSGFYLIFSRSYPQVDLILSWS